MNSLYQQMALNPRLFQLKKWITQVLHDDNPPHLSAVERMSSAIHTEGDLKELGMLILAIYQSGYQKALQECQEQLNASGSNIRIDVNYQKNQG